MKNVLTIAGFDPSSGAGITKDLDVFLAMGLHPFAVPTAYVIQGPRGVRDVRPVPDGEFGAMVSVLEEETPIHGLKLGVLWGPSFCRRAAALCEGLEGAPVVCDPVTRAKNGAVLLTDEGLKALREYVLPRCTVVTPNIPEASLLAGMDVSTVADMETCGKRILDLGAGAVVVKGGHLGGDPVDVLVDLQETILWKRQRIDRVVHGTGCIFSSLLLAYLVYGYPLKEAFRALEERMETTLRTSYFPGGEGYGYASPALKAHEQSERHLVLSAMKEAMEQLVRQNPVELVPEVQMNMGYGIAGATGIGDVAAFPGRIGRHRDRLHLKGEPEFGASSHVARLVLTYMSRFPHMRSAVNLRCDRRFVDRAADRGLEVVFFDRMKEPEDSKIREGKSLDFIISAALTGATSPPDVIYDGGDVGKEPIIRLFARDPRELIEKMEMLRS